MSAAAQETSRMGRLVIGRRMDGATYRETTLYLEIINAMFDGPGAGESFGPATIEQVAKHLQRPYEQVRKLMTAMWARRLLQRKRVSQSCHVVGPPRFSYRLSESGTLFYLTQSGVGVIAD
jgi:hypothetical protein